MKSQDVAGSGQQKHYQAQGRGVGGAADTSAQLKRFISFRDLPFLSHRMFERQRGCGSLDKGLKRPFCEVRWQGHYLHSRRPEKNCRGYFSPSKNGGGSGKEAQMEAFK